MIVAIGNEPAANNGAAIYNLDSDGVLTFEFSLDEQGANDIHRHSTGEIVVVGSDPTDDWSAGNIYVKAGGGWSKKRTLPNVIHSWGACEHDGLLYVATGAHIGDNSTYEGRVFWSGDLGDTWAGSSVAAPFRVYDVISFNGRLWAVSSDESYNMKLVVSDDNGVTWSQFGSIAPRPRHRLFVYDGKLSVVDFDLGKIHQIDTGNNVTELVPPQVANNYNVTAVVGSALYILAGANADKVYRYDGSWHYHANLGEKCCSLLNFEGSFLIASTLGVDAKILNIPLSAAG